MRLFVGIDIEEEIRRALSVFAEGLRDAAPRARWTAPHTFHITLKFIGENANQSAIATRLGTLRQPATAITFQGAGFFPSPRAARVFWAGVEGDRRLPELAQAVDQALTAVGIAPESKPFKPHLTLARARQSSGNPHQQAKHSENVFLGLQQRLGAAPQPWFGTMQAREFFLYESRLSPSGARYFKLERFALTPG